MSRFKKRMNLSGPKQRSVLTKLSVRWAFLSWFFGLSLSLPFVHAQTCPVTQTPDRPYCGEVSSDAAGSCANSSEDFAHRMSSAERSRRRAILSIQIARTEEMLRSTERALQRFHEDLRDYNRARIAADLSAAAASFSFSGLTVALMIKLPVGVDLILSPLIAVTGTIGGLTAWTGFLYDADQRWHQRPTADYSELSKITEHAFDRSAREVDQFLNAATCNSVCAPCSPLPVIQLLSLYRQVESDYRQAMARVDREAPESQVEFLSDRSSKVIRYAEIPRAEAVFAIERAKLGFLRSLQAEISQ